MRPETIRCPFCGKEIPLKGARRCPHCREWLDPAGKEREFQARTRGYAGGCGALLFASLFLYAAIATHNMDYALVGFLLAFGGVFLRYLRRWTPEDESSEPSHSL